MDDPAETRCKAGMEVGTVAAMGVVRIEVIDVDDLGIDVH